MGEKRRGVGEGSIYRREDGRWVGRYEVEGKRRYVYGQDRESVRAKLTKVLADPDAGLVFDPRNLTVAEYAPLWLGSIKQAVGPRICKRHEELTRSHVIPRLGSTKLDKLNALRVRAIYRKKLGAGLSRPPGPQKPNLALAIGRRPSISGLRDRVGEGPSMLGQPKSNNVVRDDAPIGTVTPQLP